MKRGQNDIRDINASRTSIKLPLSLIASIVVGVAITFWSQFEAYKQYTNERFDELRGEIYKKSADRYTGTQARQFEESVKQRFLDIEKANIAERRTLQYQIEECQRHTCVGR